MFMTATVPAGETMNRADRRRTMREAGYRGRASKRGVPAAIAARNAEQLQTNAAFAAKAQAEGEARARLASLRVWTPGT